MRTSILVLTAATLAACASNEQGLRSPATAPPVILQSGTGADVRLARDERVNERQLGASMDSVFTATRAIYRALGMPIQSENRRDGVIESGHFAAPREFLDQPITALLDCGHSISGARVNTWAVTLQLMTGMRPHPDAGTLVGTRVVASARTRDGSSTPPVPCSSTGRIERELANRIAARVGS